MFEHSRREFLVGSATAGLAALGSGVARAAAAADGKPLDMAIAKWSGEKNLDAEHVDLAAGKMVQQAIAAMGGMGRFVKRGDVVWVKPNIGWDRRPELAANTNPQIVARVIEMCFEAGAKVVKVGDNPVHAAQKTYFNSGIGPAAEKLGAKVVVLDKTRVRKTDIQGERVKQVALFPEILDCDLVINIPIVKHHVLAKLTMCMKNWMGIMENRPSFHQDMPTCLADLSRFMQPRARLSILDGIRVLTDHGPTGGKLEDVQVKMALAVGTDIIALDAWGTELIGRKPSEIATLVKGQATGLGKMDYRSLALRELAVS
jgi:uncharacterized protein (DUF362 family)